MNTPGAALAVGVLGAVVLIGAVWVVTVRNLFRAALSLGIVLIGVAGLFIVLRAEFLAFVQILVYVGAILTLVVFAIMLTVRLHAGSDMPVGRQRAASGVASLLLFVVIVAMTQGVVWPVDTAAEPVDVAMLGQQLVTTLVLPFEVISLVFVAAIIGAVALASSPSTPTKPSRAPSA